jgi:hypothetical protein
VSQISEAIQNLRDKLGSFGKKGGGGGESEKSGGFDAKKALAWIKSNPVSVASIGVMLVAPAVAWWVAGDIKAERVRLAESRAQEWANLEKLEKASIEITLPGRAAEAMTGTVSSKSVNAYKALAARLKSDAVSAQQRAREINQGGRTKLIADVRVTKDNSSVIAEEVFDAVRARAATTGSSTISSVVRTRSSPPSARPIASRSTPTSSSDCSRRSPRRDCSCMPTPRDPPRSMAISARLTCLARPARQVRLRPSRACSSGSGGCGSKRTCSVPLRTRTRARAASLRHP